MHNEPVIRSAMPDFTDGASFINATILWYIIRTLSERYMCAGRKPNTGRDLQNGVFVLNMISTMALVTGGRGARKFLVLG